MSDYDQQDTSYTQKDEADSSSATEHKQEEGKKEAKKEGKKEQKANKEDKQETSKGRTRQREFFKGELKRLQVSLKEQSSKIQPPPRRKNAPYVFNTLEPYYNTYTTKFLIDLPDDSMQIHTFSSRSTAQGLTDPWIDLRMDQEILPQITSRPVTTQLSKPLSFTSTSRSKGRNNTSQQGPSRREGSTMLPKFPIVAMETKDFATKQLYYTDVPMLRRELKTKYSSQAKSKVKADYKRTQQDFYRMDLDRMDQVAPSKRKHLKDAYIAYLQNTPGSRRAIQDCVKTLEGKAH